MSYVETIEPRLTPYRPATPADTADTLVEWCRDLDEELTARLRLMSPDDLAWQPHPDANSPGVTVWHVARWLDVLAIRAFTSRPATDELWHTGGFSLATGYEPDGIGYLGLGTLTGYSPEEMRAVPAMPADLVGEYLHQSATLLINTIGDLRARLHTGRGDEPTPYQSIGATLQGSFGHIGEIDTLVALRARLTARRDAG
jgi:hypothetical protein